MTDIHLWSEVNVQVPDHDCDIHIKLTNGKTVTVQLRPSNADVNYNGSLDIILPEDTVVTCWEGDDMQAAKAVSARRQHERMTKQLVLELP